VPMAPMMTPSSTKMRPIAQFDAPSAFMIAI
jgi:hypothetical protein